MKQTLHTLLGTYPNTMALKNAIVQSSWLDFDFADVKVPNRAFKRVVRDLEFDLAELALVTAFQAHAYHKPLNMIPAVVGAGRYQHHCLVYNQERNRIGVSQLAGKTIGIRAHAQTTVTWVRGILSNEYGVDLKSIKWVTFEDGHLEEFPDPKGFKRAKKNQSMVEMLLSGELDAAIIGTDLPDDERLKSVIPDPHEAAQAWGERHQLVPINHMMMIKTDWIERHPEMGNEIYRLLLESKSRLGVAPHEGRDLTPFGIEANRNALELLILYCYQQGLIPSLYRAEDLFHACTRFK